ncbi:hypothetical protein IAR50_002892 [Cryptococcus sp. DSM 104548]
MSYPDSKLLPLASTDVNQLPSPPSLEEAPLNHQMRETLYTFKKYGKFIVVINSDKEADACAHVEPEAPQWINLNIEVTYRVSTTMANEWLTNLQVFDALEKAYQYKGESYSPI